MTALFVVEDSLAQAETVKPPVVLRAGALGSIRFAVRSDQ
jgi:hypothetical protein